MLCAVAVVNVEIHHRDLLNARGLLGMTGGDGDRVEQTKPHGLRRFRMVARRAHGTEGVARLAAENRIDRGTGAAGGAERGFRRFRRHAGVRVQVDTPFRGHVVHHRFHVVVPVSVFDHAQVEHRRFKAQQIGERLGLQGLHDRAQAFRAFRMAATRVMLHAGLMEI